MVLSTAASASNDDRVGRREPVVLQKQGVRHVLFCGQSGSRLALEHRRRSRPVRPLPLRQRRLHQGWNPSGHRNHFQRNPRHL
ncbi:hypothetical protein L596_015489 [Steinernema carpocapsae]|uniref:Uncharacterized protein n=1 Tax=Steinernema carpocapsae TaxID=34508 RepID=A0A4U5NG48_STECR|nr:hypothetical protein L596_015489 [Steinernema carpocapsae]